MQLLYDAATITITYDPAQECLLVTWQGTHPGWSALPYCEEILAHVRATGCSRILNDGSQDEDEWGELVGWLTADFSRGSPPMAYRLWPGLSPPV
jgi:hypothetical protein